MLNKSPLVSVIISTYNREKYLNNYLKNILKQDYHNFEVLIIDQSSNTSKKFIKYINSLKNIVRYYKASFTNLSLARNMGIKNAKGDIVVFIDDDALAEKKWLSEIVRTFKITGAHAVGGKIDPLWQNKKPDWIKNNMLWVFSILDYADQITDFVWPACPIGTNMAIQKDVFTKLGMFNKNICHQGSKLLYNDEVEFINKLFINKFKIIYTPLAIVKHIIPSNKITKKYLLKRYFYQGVSDRQLANLNKSIKEDFKKSKDIFLKNLFVFIIKKHTFDKMCYIMQQLGFMIGKLYI